MSRGSSTTQIVSGSRRSSPHTAQSSPPSATLKQTAQRVVRSFTAMMASASRRASSEGTFKMWNAMRCADFGPMPGNRPSSSMRERRGPVYIVEWVIPSFVVERPVAVAPMAEWAQAAIRILRAGFGLPVLLAQNLAGSGEGFEEPGLGLRRLVAFCVGADLRVVGRVEGLLGLADRRVRRWPGRRASRRLRYRSALVHVQHELHRSPEVRAQSLLDRGDHLEAAVPVRCVREREVRPLLVHRDEAACAEECLGPRGQAFE